MHRLTGKTLRRVGATLVSVSGVLWMLWLSGSGDGVQTLQTAALISAGLQQPEAGLAALADTLSSTTSAAALRTTSAPAVSSSTVGTSRTTARTTAGGGSLSPLSAPSQAVPENCGTGGKILSQMLSAGTEFVNGVAIRNRSRVTVSLQKEATAPLEFRLSADKGPKVLIVHTHTTESYMLYDAGFYNAGDAERTRDTTRNVCAVGDAVARELEARGIGVVHDRTFHDDPRYRGAYTRSEETVKRNLKEHPTIQVVLDLHRDCIMRNDTDKIKPTVTVAGKKAAQMMMVMGVADTASSPHPKWRENLHLAMALQSRLSQVQEGLVRPISLTNSRYNQHLSSGYMLVEMGSDANTLAEAMYSGSLLGQSLAQVMLDSQKTK